LAAFARFNGLLTATWLGGAALTTFDAWLEGLAWPEVEERFAAYYSDFTGVAMPPGFARLEGFTPGYAVYPAGYVLAHTRVANWLRHLRTLGGEAWWESPDARADIRSRMAAGGAARFPAEWNEPEAYLAEVGAGASATGTWTGA
jgi:hypothetical protein